MDVSSLRRRPLRKSIHTKKSANTSATMVATHNGGMDFDDALEHVGTFGWIQVFNLMVLTLPGWVGGFYAIAMTFVGITPRFICEGKPNEDPCTVTPPCEKFVYESSFTSIATEWNLVCENKQYADLAQSAYMFGGLIGNFVWGSLGDKYGRMGLIILSNALQVLVHMAAAYAQTYQQFVVNRVVEGLVNGGATVVSFTMALENLHSSKRSFGGMMMAVSFAISFVFTSLWASRVTEWRAFLWTSNVFMLPFFALVWFAPKSARWLASQGRTSEAEDILFEWSQKNGKSLSRGSVKLKRVDKGGASTAARQSYGVLDLFRTPKMAKRMNVLILGWLMSGAVYFGLTISSNSLGGNMYVNVALSGLVELPSAFLSAYLGNRIGRIKTIAGMNMLTIVMCLAVVLAPFNPDGGMTSFQTYSALTAKMGIAGAYNLQAPFSTELLPTCLRTVGMGVCYMFSRIGGILAPMLITYFSVSSVYLLYALGASVYTAAMMTLKETLNQPLPDTIDDVENS